MTNDLSPWHRRAWAGVAIRAAGLAVLLLAWRAGDTMTTDARMHMIGAKDYLFALIAFLGISAGAAAATLGTHLFDRVPIASRWSHARLLSPPQPRPGSSSR